jgi:signal transduction histidine kinase
VALAARRAVRARLRAPPADGMKWLRRLWPHKVRLRLTLLFAGLFLAAGCALLGLTYGLVAASVPAHPRSARGTSSYANARAKLENACRQPTPDPGLVKQCKQLADAAAKSAASAATDTRQQALHSLLLYSALGLAAMTAASGGIGWIISGRVLRPVVKITETARRASEQHLGERLALAGAQDELKELADTFDDMLDRLDRAFAAQRRFVANASHELRTPLTAMRTAIDVTLAKQAPTPRQLADMAVRVRRSIGTAEAMIDALLTLAISDQGTVRSEFLDLSAVAEDALDLAAPGIARLCLDVTAKLQPAEAYGDPQLIERMIWNLVDNAVQHNIPDGWIRLHTGLRDGHAFFQIANSGGVVPAACLPALTEPFRRLAGRVSSRGGAGLGLSIAQSVSVAHGTTLDIRSQPGGGLEILVELASRG